MRALLSLERKGLEGIISAGGGRPFHAESLRAWVLHKGVFDYDRMSDLPEGLRAFLRDRVAPLASRVVERREAPDGTVKLLLELADGERIETVVMPGAKRGESRTICVSTQVGCPVACRFCASGAAGLVRNLEAHEIVEQFLHGRAVHPFSRAVVMGIGEPTLNLDNLLRALAIVTDPKGFGLGARKVTISTVGYPERIRKLAESGKPYNLAVSLHAPEDTLRREIVPTMQKVEIDEIVRAADEYFEKTGRETTFEYVLLAGVNDLPRHAESLARRLRGSRCTANLIPYNPVEGFPFQRPSAAAVQLFAETLRRNRIPATVRWSKGLEADAACGQLRIRQR